MSQQLGGKARPAPCQSCLLYKSRLLDQNGVSLLLAVTLYCLLSTPRTFSKSLLCNFFFFFFLKKQSLLERLMVCYSRYLNVMLGSSQMTGEPNSWTQCFGSLYNRSD